LQMRANELGILVFPNSAPGGGFLPLLPANSGSPPRPIVRD
jgi:hypothetical protein